MKTLHTEISIGAAAPIVWDVISDLERWSEWNPVMRVTGNLAQSQWLDVTIAAPGAEGMQFKSKVVMLDEGKEFRWQVRKMLGMFDAEHGFRVIPEDVGRCRFEQFEVFRGLLSGAIYTRQSKALNTGFVAMNRMLKREAEKRAKD